MPIDLARLRRLPLLPLTWLLTRIAGMVLLIHPVYLVSFRVRGDLLLYADYARQLQAGQLPYRDFALEYPPAFLPFLLWPAHSDTVYITLFVSTAVAVDGLVQRALRTRPLGRWIWAVAPVALGPIFWARQDVFVAAAAVAFVLWAERGHWRRAGAALAVMGLLKLWPLALLVTLLPAVPAKARKRFLVGAGTTGVIALLPLVALGAGPGLIDVLRFHSERGVEVEALAAVPLHISAVLGHGPAIEALFGSLQFATSAWLRQVLGLAFIAALLASGLIARRLRTCGLDASLLAAVVLVLVTSKVLSPQYFIWAAAAVALAIDRHPRPAELAYGIMTALASAQLLFPFLFIELLLENPAVVMLAVIHALAVILLALAALAPLLSPTRHGGEVTDEGLRARRRGLRQVPE